MQVLVVSPHPDDETLGAGASLLRHKEEGASIYWANITNIKEEYGYSMEDVSNKQLQIENAIKSYGVDGFIDLALKPSSLNDSHIPIIIDKISVFIEKVKPAIMYVPFYGDAHSDHRITFKALQPFFKSFRYPYISRVLMMEIVSETDSQFIKTFKPNVFVDVSNHIDKKLEILSIYSSEIGDHPFPRSLENIKSLALYRGSQSGCTYAESFMLIKEVL